VMGLGTHIAESANLEDDVDFECPRVHVRVLSSSVGGSSTKALN